MNIIPAIDLKEGSVVRLTRGDRKEAKVYSGDPADIARKWHSQGAAILHVVDLDGALAGEPKNKEAIEAIAKAVVIPIQLGGGLRTANDIDWALSAGVTKIILGTKALEDLNFITEAIKKYGERIIVSIDSKDGLVMLDGWTKTSGKSAIEMAKGMELIGVSNIIYTDVTLDGTLGGPHLMKISNFVSNVSSSVTIAGGIGSLNDIKRLRGLKKKNLTGVILGRALYEGTIDLSEAINICLQKE